MHHSLGIFSFTSWVWPALIISLVLAIIGFIIYKVTRKRSDEDAAVTWSPLSGQESLQVKV
jgi:hypothetical protein